MEKNTHSRPVKRSCIRRMLALLGRKSGACILTVLLSMLGSPMALAGKYLDAPTVSAGGQFDIQLKKIEATPQECGLYITPPYDWEIERCSMGTVQLKVYFNGEERKDYNRGQIQNGRYEFHGPIVARTLHFDIDEPGEWTFRYSAFVFVTFDNSSSEEDEARPVLAEHTVTILPPTEPESLSVPTFNTASPFTVHWGKSTPEGIGKYGIERYVVQRQRDAGPWQTIYDQLPQPRDTIVPIFNDDQPLLLKVQLSGRSLKQPVLPDGSYRYRVRACAGNFCSPFRTSDRLKVQDTPARPVDFKVADYSSLSSTSVSWREGSGGGTQDRIYKLEEQVRRKGEDSYGAWDTIYSGTETRVTAYTREHKASYRYRLSACNMTCSSYAPVQTQYVEYMPSDAKLTELAPISRTGRFNVSWSPSDYAAYYLLQEVGPDGLTVEHRLTDQFKAMDYEDNGVYTYRVKACNTRALCTGWSASASIEVDIQLPAPAEVSARPNPVYNGTAVTLSWSALPEYSVYYQVVLDNGIAIDITEGTQHTLSDLTHGSHRISVRACLVADTAVCSPYTSATIESVHRPNKPATPMVPRWSNGSHTVSWNGVQGATEYHLEQSVNNAPWEAVYNGQATEYAHAPDGQPAYGVHRYRLAVSNAAGRSVAFSEVAAVMVLPEVTNLTARPAILKAGESAELTWDVVNTDTVYYQLRQPDGTIKSLEQNKTGRYVAKLDENGAYTYAVRACSVTQKDICAAFAKIVVRAVFIPTTPRGLQVPNSVDPSEKSYTVTWPSVPHATHYRLELVVDAAKSLEQVADAVEGDVFTRVYETAGLSQSIAFSDIPLPYGKHHFRLQAYNAAGASDYSESQTVSVAVDPTDTIRKLLYYGEADAIPASSDLPAQNHFSREKAAFRYMELSYVLDPETNKVIYRFGDGLLDSDGDGVFDNDFSDLYGQDERKRVELARSLIKEQLRTYPDNSNVKRFLLDVYFDQAVAEIVSGNQLLDQARILRLREGYEDNINGPAGSSIKEEVKIYQEAAKLFADALATYSKLFADENGKAIVAEYQKTRGALSPRYRDDNDVAQDVVRTGLYDGYKDVRVYFELMASWADALTRAVRLEVIGGQSNETLIDVLRQQMAEALVQLADYRRLVEDIFLDTDLGALPGFNGVPTAIARYETTRSRLLDMELFLCGGIEPVAEDVNAGQVTDQQAYTDTEQGQCGSTNLLGLPRDAVLLRQGSDSDDNLKTFDWIMKHHSPNAGTLQRAMEDWLKANRDFEQLQINQDALATDFRDRLDDINQRLFSLAGIRLNEQCPNGICVDAGQVDSGSALAQQMASIKNANLFIEQRETTLKNIVAAIENEVDRRNKEQGIESDIINIGLEYAGRDSMIVGRINNIRKRQARKRSRFGSITGMINTVTSAISAGAVSSSAGVASFVGGMANVIISSRHDKQQMKLNSTIGELERQRLRLAAEETARIRGQQGLILDINSEARIKDMWLQMRTAEIDITIAEVNQEAEIERFTAMLDEYHHLLSQAIQLREAQSERYFADPIHLARSSRSLEVAEASFAEAQRWMFYAVQALEYKWQEDFVGSDSLDADSLFRLRNADELERFYTQLQAFDSARALVRGFESPAMDTVSMKRDILGYYPTLDGVLQCYPHPFPERRTELAEWLKAENPSLYNECEFEGEFADDLLDADYAFMIYMAGSIVNSSGGSGEQQWINMGFSTLHNPVSQLFLGPDFRGMGAERCLFGGGTYNDKITRVGVNVVLNNTLFDQQTRARLSYGGSSYFRVRRSDGLNSLSDVEELEAALNKVEVVSPQFWDVNGNNVLTRTNRYTSELGASLVEQGGTLSRPSFAFRERSVAASGWQLSVLQRHQRGAVFNLTDLDDIEVMIEHQYINRGISTCPSSRSALLPGDLGVPDSLRRWEYLPDDELLIEEILHRESLK